VVALLAGPSSAAAAPNPCKHTGPPPEGIAVDHLYAKLNGTWVVPDKVCVTVGRFSRTLPNGVTRRGLTIELGEDGAEYPWFDLRAAGVPAGTRISLGLTLPAGSSPAFSLFGARDMVAAFTDTHFAIQGTTFPAMREWMSRLQGQRPDCDNATMNESLFTGGVQLHSLNPDGSRSDELDPLADSFFGTDAQVGGAPQPTIDAEGNKGVLIRLTNCGDGDDANKEGFYQGFLSLNALEASGMRQTDLEDGSELIDRLMRMRDALASRGIDSDFSVVRHGDLGFESIPGVTFPRVPARDDRPIGVFGSGVFGYSDVGVTTEALQERVKDLRGCTAGGGRPAAKGDDLGCVPDRSAPKASLRAPSTTTPKALASKAVTVKCNEACRARLQILVRGKVVGTGSGKTHFAGTFDVAVKLGSAIKNQLKRGPVAAVISARVTDRAGNPRTVKRTVKLKA
jgi:hypothetical protein